MKLHTWVKDWQLSLSFLQVLISISGWEDNVHYKCFVMYLPLKGEFLNMIDN